MRPPSASEITSLSMLGERMREGMGELRMCPPWLEQLISIDHHVDFNRFRSLQTNLHVQSSTTKSIEKLFFLAFGKILVLDVAFFLFKFQVKRY